MFNCKISFWRLLTIFVIVVIFKVEMVSLISNQSHLCEAKDLPCEKESGGQCRMKYFKLNSTDCRDMAFSENPMAAESDLGKVQIRSYHYSMISYKQTGFNLTFNNISWHLLKFRFKQEGNEMKNTCREFHRSPNSTLKNLFYDCLWSNENYEGKTFTLEYEASRENLVTYRRYSFRVPFAKHIEETTTLSSWEIFILVEVVKNAFGLTTFVLHWQPLPQRFNISTYNISVYSNVTGQPQVIFSTNVTCDDMDDCKYCYNKWYGNVQFGIQPACSNETQCFISKTVVFLLGGENAKPLLIGIVSVTLVIPASIYFLYFMRMYLLRKSKKWICSVPKVLVVFTPSLSYHVNVVFALVEYLKMYCNIEPLVDELHIFLSKSKDPFKWCNEAFKAADAVMVVASPYHKHLRLADSVYQNTDVLLLRLLKERLGSRESRTRFFVLKLPYTSDEDIPNEAVNLRKFSFPEDLNKMLKFVHKDASLPDCLSSEIQGGKENYKLLGGKLSSAIAETQVNLKKNRSEYERMIEEMRSEKEEPEDSLLRETKKEEKLGEGKTRDKKSVMALAEEIFGEFPGRLDDMNLSGEETESLMGSQKTPMDTDVLDLDALDL